MRVLQVGVFASLVYCIWSNVYRELFDPKTADNRKGEALWVNSIEGATAQGGGLFLKYDFGDQGENAAFAQTIYLLGVFRLYPQRALVADPSVKINDGHDILRNNTYPDDRWLKQQGISTVMSIIMDGRLNLPFVKSVRRVQ